uniref:HORMA domain-containing protein n=1 Tax=Chromera velia CCMP2878 TaxID=1169474 RepID=A0A0G4H3Q7_9ALVE|eukprot:Cvel_5638.t1-p1 / transcript=Cvel_5638.t1 / gene=Cvel_5638 / organism=Chromera_velia_CCMP2878 / gene_product=hypothetical protein / transcript_product=hypothetical protein / location=Cvel_scaffold266:3506-7183(+) / protein_length=226 / sequence_SO=supercontig / SO=protein_coding / is_pseudo=false
MSHQGPLEFLAERFAEFLETACHTILYSRTLYPPRTFERIWRFGLRVWWCRARSVHEYIRETCHMLKDLLHKRLLREFALLVLDGDAEVVERFAFRATDCWGLSEIVRRDGGGRADLDASSLYAHFRAALGALEGVETVAEGRLRARGAIEQEEDVWSFQPVLHLTQKPSNSGPSGLPVGRHRAGGKREFSLIGGGGQRLFISCPFVDMHLGCSKLSDPLSIHQPL